MRAQHAYQQYRKVQVETANQGKLIIMLYQGCIKFLNRALKGLEEKDLELVNNSLIRAQDILNELMVSLDREKGGQIAENLFRLYEFMNYQLVRANIKKDAELIKGVKEMLQDLLEAWQEIVSSGKTKAGADGPKTQIEIEAGEEG